MFTRRVALAGLAGLPLLPAAVRAQASAVAGELAGPLARYKGTTVRFLTERNAHQLALAAELGRIAHAAGITFETRYITTDEIEKMVVIDYAGGAATWVFIYTGGVQRMAEWAYGGIILDLAPTIERIGDPKLLDWSDFTASARHAVTFEDKIFGITCATSEQAMVWRKDLFENAEEKAAFRKRYGYDLAPPETYAAVHDVAEFFTRKPGAMLAGKKLTADFYGTILAAKRGTFLWHTYENYVAAFGVEIYDPKTRKVGLTAPANLALVQAMKALVPFMPPDYINMTSGEIAESFAHGDAAFIGEYFDRLVLVLSAPGTVGLGNVGFGFFPSAPGNPLGRQHGARSGPPVVSISSRSRHADAAYKLLEAACSVAGETEMMQTSVGYFPSRTSVLEALAKRLPVSEYLLRLSAAVAAGKVSALTDRDILPYPAITKAAEIVDAVTTPLSDILVGAAVKPKLGEMQASVEALLPPA